MLRSEPARPDGHKILSPACLLVLLLGWKISLGNGLDKTQKASDFSEAFVPEAGLEPARPDGHKILSLACLPVPPLRHRLLDSQVFLVDFKTYWP